MDELTVERKGNVEVLTLNRPEVMNALTYDMAQGLGDLFEAAQADDGIRAVLHGRRKGFLHGRRSHRPGQRQERRSHAPGHADFHVRLLADGERHLGAGKAGGVRRQRRRGGRRLQSCPVLRFGDGCRHGKVHSGVCAAQADSRRRRRLLPAPSGGTS